VESLQAARRTDGRPVVTAQVRNTGERALDIRGELALSDGPGGLSAGPFPVTVGTTLAVGATAPVEVVLDEAIKGGPWRTHHHDAQRVAGAAGREHVLVHGYRRCGGGGRGGRAAAAGPERQRRPSGPAPGLSRRPGSGPYALGRLSEPDRKA